MNNLNVITENQVITATLVKAAMEKHGLVMATFSDGSYTEDASEVEFTDMSKEFVVYVGPCGVSFSYDNGDSDRAVVAVNIEPQTNGAEWFANV